MNLPEEDVIAPPDRGDDVVLVFDEDSEPEPEGTEHELRSLREDVEALIEDGKTYLQTELVFQKTRAAFVADRAKGAVVFGAVAVLLAFLALIGLTVGLIIALTPLLTAWGASALVVGLLIVAALIAAKAASGRWARLMHAIQDDARGPQ